MFSKSSVSEWTWVVVVSAVILLITTIPVVIGFQSETNDLAFSGTVFNRQDFAVHMASMRQGANGQFTYSLRFSSEPAAPKPVKLFYIGLGHLAGWLNLELPWVYHATRIGLGFMALILVYALMGRTFLSIRLRRLGYLLAATAAGLGWLMLLFNWLPNQEISPIDFWLMDLYLFFSLATFPHYAAVLILILVMILAHLNFLVNAKYIHWCLAALAGVLIIPIQPFSIAIADLAVGGLLIGKWRSEGRMNPKDLIPVAGYVGVQIPFVLVNWLSIQTDPFWSQFSRQNILLSPPSIYYLLGIGLLFPFALWGAWIAWMRRNVVGIMSASWVVGAFLLSYAPTLLQRRFSLGLTIPLGLLAAGGIGLGLFPILTQIFDLQAKRRFGLLVLIVVSFSMISSIYLIVGSSVLVRIKPENLYDQKIVIKALQQLDDLSTADEVVLASYRTGMVIPTVSNLRSFIGHPIETLDFQRKSYEVDQFYAGILSGRESSEFLAECGCEWIFIGPYEGESDRVDPSQGLELELKYMRDGIRIYRVAESDV